MNDSTTPTTGRRTSARTRNLIIAAVIVVAAGAWYGVHLYRAKASKAGDYIFAAVQKGDIEDLVTSTGTLQPRDYVDVGAQVTGQIEKLYVDVGDQVKEGDKLADLDATQSQARVDADIASLKSSKTNLDNQKNNLVKAERDYLRQQNLLKDDATTQQAALDAETALNTARNQIITSQAQIDQQEANMRVEVQNLKYTTIIAPISGTVMSLSVKQGQTINATQSAPTVLRIANLGTMSVQSDVSEADVSKLYKGISVYFTTLGSGNRRWFSTLKRIDPTPKTQNSVVLYNALFDIDNENGSLMPSMTAQVYFINAQARGVLTVPMAALQQGQQIQRELAAKEKKDGKTPAAGAGAPGAAPAGAAGAPAATSNTPAAGAAPATPAAPGANPANAQANAQAGGQQGNRPANSQGGAAAGNGAGGQRPAGGFGGGFPGGQAMQNMTPEQREELIRRFREQRAANGGGNGGFGGGAGGFGGGNFRQGQGAAGVTGRPAQRRTGTVMVKKADGTLEARRVVIGVTNRVSGEVLEGLKEGEEVVIGKHEDEAAAAPRTNTPNQQQNQNRPPNFQGGGFPAGGGFPGGGRF
ncbi:MAG: efflux RND transporter periplasmic adaptor subunit [Pseudomonadota bacterium]